MSRKKEVPLFSSIIFNTIRKLTKKEIEEYLKEIFKKSFLGEKEKIEFSFSISNLSSDKNKFFSYSVYLDYLD